MLSRLSSLETSGPALHLCSMAGLTSPGLPSSLPFPGKAWPDRGSLGPLDIGPVSTTAAPSRVLTASCRALPGPAASRVPSIQSGPTQSALLLLLRRPSLSSGACCPACPVLWVWTCFPAFHSRSEGALGTAGPVPYTSPGPRTPSTQSGSGTVLRKFSVNNFNGAKNVFFLIYIFFMFRPSF